MDGALSPLTLPTAVAGGIGASLLVAARLSGALLAAPLLRGAHVPVRLRSGVVVALAGGLLASGALREVLASRGAHLVGLIERAPGTGLLVLVSELLLGAVCGWTILVVFAAVRGASQLISAQIGFGSALVDPVGGEGDHVLSRFHTLLAVLVFFSLDLHLSLIRAVVESLVRVEPLTLSAAAVPALLTNLALRTGTDLVAAAVALAAAVIVAMSVVSVVQGLLGRALPEAELLVLGIPVRVVVGLAVLAVALPTTAGLVRVLLDRAIDDGRLVLSSVGG